MLVNNKEHLEAEILNQAISKLSHKYRLNPRTATVGFGDMDGRLVFRMQGTERETREPVDVCGIVNNAI